MTTGPRKLIRLPRQEYRGKRIYFLTICAGRRRPIFENPARANVAILELRKIAERMDIFVHAFCVMPDHVHLLVEGKTANASVVRFIAQWKQSTGYLFRRELPPRFWQRQFYDHILRKAEGSESVAWYIWMNPVRKGIVAEPGEYPFSGSFTTDWPRTAPPAEAWMPPWRAPGTR